MRHSVYSYLKSLGYSPDYVVDCGSAQGEWSGIIKSVFPNITLLSVDALNWFDGNHPHTHLFEQVVLSDENDKDVLFYRKDEGNCTGDSIFKENTFNYKTTNLVVEKRKTKTLRYICEKNNITKIDLLKIDTQGSEILILKGLGDLLNIVDFLEIECSVVNWNGGGCMMVDVIDFLKPTFDIFEVTELHRHNGGLIQLDFLFQNKNNKIEKNYGQK
jgi:FkbM family methyltransferase